MKTTKEWMGSSLVCPRPPAPGHTYKPNDCDRCYEEWVARIQADALRHAIETLSGMLAYETEHMRKSVADCIGAEAKEIEGSPTK